MNRFFYAFLAILSSCSEVARQELSAELNYQSYCGSCHLAPDPSNIPKFILEDRVLPEMAARLGYNYNDYNPLARNSMEENLYIRLSNVYPEQPLIDSITWTDIYNYIVELAPDSIAPDHIRSKRNFPLDRFRPEHLTLDRDAMAFVTQIYFDSHIGQFIIGDGYGRGFVWPRSPDAVFQFSSPFIGYRQMQDSVLYLTEIGYMNPSEVPRGSMQLRTPDQIDTIATKLHRPVFTEVVDLNNDGRDEVLVCEFGNHTGELSMLVKTESGYDKRTLLPVPGTIKLEIKDMDLDGRRDIVVLASQGNEGIYVLYQKDGLNFSVEQLIRLPPEYGLSWFEMLDFDGDDDPDIILANGDNADYSVFSKPYHGVRLYLNDGQNNYQESWFYPIYGATRVLAEDFDSDGDYDFAVLAFFPDFQNIPEESFVYLENESEETLRFRSYVLADDIPGRWLVMDKGDVDKDGDADLLLGAFNLPPGNNKEISESWMKNKVDLLFLENLSRPNDR